MNRRMAKSMLFSIGVHALLLMPVSFGGGFTSNVSTDVLRGISSIELEWVASPKLLSRDVPPEGGASPGKNIPSPGDPTSPEISLGDGEKAQEKESKKGTAAPAQQEAWVNDDGATLRTEPSALRNPAPRYPWAARLHGWEGTVIVQALVTPIGRADSVRVIKSSGFPSLDEAALVSLRQWQFIPARRQGQIFASQVEIPIRFKLEKQEKEQ